MSLTLPHIPYFPLFPHLPISLRLLFFLPHHTAVSLAQTHNLTLSLLLSVFMAALSDPREKRERKHSGEGWTGKERIQRQRERWGKREKEGNGHKALLRLEKESRHLMDTDAQSNHVPSCCWLSNPGMNGGCNCVRVCVCVCVCPDGADQPSFP